MGLGLGDGNQWERQQGLASMTRIKEKKKVLLEGGRKGTCGPISSEKSQ